MLADREFTPEAFLHHIFDPEAKRFYTDLAYHFIGKSIHQQHPGIFFTDTTLSQIKHGFAVKLTRRGTMAAFDIVSIDLEERF